MFNGVVVLLLPSGGVGTREDEEEETALLLGLIKGGVDVLLDAEEVEPLSPKRSRLTEERVDDDPVSKIEPPPPDSPVREENRAWC